MQFAFIPSFSSHFFSYKLEYYFYYLSVLCKICLQHMKEMMIYEMV